ncbi:ABC transporter substrate-binding protein [Devosia naphthalenivorans]|uniref:ABC transporter substrate-binding protein n=1 Tax=Devosia naphthalenivorans TaxID=2082392 RepID=UPI000D33E2C5|nr:ABC transporter substrate-binding protein [Devosia naphthalenivorans]
MLKLFTRGTAILGALISMSSPVVVFAQDELTPIRGGLVVQSTDVEPTSMDPGFGNAPGKDIIAFRTIYENLFYQSGDGTLVPQLATEWTIADDGLSIDFKIREGVTFHDGTTLDAAAVAYNFNRSIDPAIGTRNATFLGDLAGAEVLGEYDLRLTLKQPSSIVISSIANEMGMIASPTAMEALGADFARNPVGTGPFKFDRWQSGDRIEFSRYDGYWGKDENGEQLPYLDRVELRIIVDAVTKVIAAESGAVHLVDTVQPRDYQRIEDNPELELVPNIATNYNLLSFNQTRPPFDNVLLRKALTAAIDRDLILQVIYPGTGMVMHGIFPDYAQEYNPDLKDYEFNPERAAELYKESGYSGPPLTMTLIQRDPDTTISQILQSQWEAAGIPIQIELLERLAWTDKVYGHDYELALHRLTGPRANSDIPNRYGRDAGADHTGQTALFDVVDKIRTTIPDDERNGYYRELQQIIVDEAIQMPLVGQREHVIASKKVMGLSRELNGNWLLSAAWLQQ